MLSKAANRKSPCRFHVLRGGLRGTTISASANKIIAQPSTITGSIGVVGGKPVMKGFYDWIGISNEYVLRGKTAGLFRETEKFTPDERAKFEEWIKTTYYNDFVPKVARGRGKDPAYIDSVGQGQSVPFTGKDTGWWMRLVVSTGDCNCQTLAISQRTRVNSVLSRTQAFCSNCLSP